MVVQLRGDPPPPMGQIDAHCTAPGKLAGRGERCQILIASHFAVSVRQRGHIIASRYLPGRGGSLFLIAYN